MMKKILGMGNALVDVLAQIDNDSVLNDLGLPKGSMQLIDTPRYLSLREKMNSWQLQRATGGSAGNTILALANLGVQTGFIGRVGNDDNGAFYVQNSQQHHINFHNVGKDGVSGVALTFISPDGQRTFGTHLGVAAELSADDISSDLYQGYDLLHVEGYLTQNHDLIDRAYTLAHEAGMLTSIDLASYNIVESDHDFFAYLLPKVDIVFANEEESKAFTGGTPEESLDTLSKICQVAVVKVGARGVLVARGDERVAVPALPAKPIDTTGAGDFFAAGFLYGLSNNLSLTASAEIGTLLAKHVIEVVGTTLSENTWQAIRQQVALKYFR